MPNTDHESVVISFEEYSERVKEFRIEYEKLEKKWKQRTLSEMEDKMVVILMLNLNKQIDIISENTKYINILYGDGEHE